MILVAGLSPAWQQIMEFESLQAGAVNRAQAVHWCASGKVLNVAIALGCLTGEIPLAANKSGRNCAPTTFGNALGSPLTLSLVGGWSGSAIRDDFAQLGLAAHWVEVPSPTRVCTTMLASEHRQTTELVENAGAVPEQAMLEFCEQFRALAQQSSFVVLTGSLPSGLPVNFYAELLRELPVPALLDVRGPELRACLPHRPFVVKPNREELELTVGADLQSEADLFAAMRELNALGARWVVVTDGPHQVYVTGPGEAFTVEPLPVTQVVNPIGCGDCLAAGLAFGLANGDTLARSLQIGLRAAADNVQQLLPARCQPHI